MTVLGKPKAQTITITDLPVKNGIAINQLGSNNDLGAKGQTDGTQIVLHAPLKGDYAYSFKLAGYLR
jgi:hypothetical protein